MRPAKEYTLKRADLIPLVGYDFTAGKLGNDDHGESAFDLSESILTPEVRQRIIRHLTDIQRGDLVELLPFNEYSQQGVYSYNGRDLISASGEDGRLKLPEDYQVILEFDINHWSNPYPYLPVPFNVSQNLPGLNVGNVYSMTDSTGRLLYYLPFNGPSGKIHLIIDYPEERSASPEEFLTRVNSSRYFDPPHQATRSIPGSSFFAFKDYPYLVVSEAGHPEFF